jgi:hypothetical protein
LKTNFIIILPTVPRLSKWYLSLRSLHQTLFAPLLSSISATCPTLIILLHLITQITFGGEYRSWSSSLCSLLHSPVTSSLLGPNTFLGQHYKMASEMI